MSPAFFLIFLLGMFSAPSLFSASGTDWKQEVTPTYIQGGDRAYIRSVSPSTSSLVVLSTDIVNANVGTHNPWRKTTIINYSTSAAMSVYFQSDYSQFSSSYGIVLSSAGANPLYNRYETGYQGRITGIWDANGYLSSVGAYVVQEYVK